MARDRLLLRNVRPKRTEDKRWQDSDVEAFHSEESASDVVSDASFSHAGLGDQSSEGTGAESEDVDEQISNVSFGALLQAQNAISRKRKRGSVTAPEQEAKLEAVRDRLRDIRSQTSKEKTTPIQRGDVQNVARPRTSSHPVSRLDANPRDRSQESGDEEDSSDSAPSVEEAPSKSRTSKHAPAAQSSRHQVTRKRNVISVPKRVFRDPRFDALQQQQSSHPGNSEKAYSFLHDYQKSEIAELKQAIKQTRNEDDKETLKRKVGSMENRIKAKEAKEREQEVLRRHRKEEREKVEQGKQPYFLKKKDLKKRVMVEKFKGMKSKDREKLMEKRRKKESQRER